MQHAISPAGVTSFVTVEQRTATAKKAQVNVFSRFINWCGEQEKSRMLWLVLSYLGQIGMALPCTLSAILFLGGNNFTLWILACIINVPVLAINLAAQSTKITIPALLFSWTADVAIIVYCAGLFYLNF